MRILFLILFLVIAHAGSAQSKKKDTGAKQQSSAPNSLNPYQQEQRTSNSPKKSSKSSKGKVTYNAERAYYERVEAVAREREKNEKLSKKPQYSDPMYFGHKKMPKKNSRKKMKFCKECGIRH